MTNAPPEVQPKKQGFTDTEKLGILLNAVKAYLDAPGQMKGELCREMAATVASLDGKEYEGYNWPAIYNKLEKKCNRLLGVMYYMQGTILMGTNGDMDTAFTMLNDVLAKES